MTTPSTLDRSTDLIERVSEFARVVGLRPNALVRQEGRTLSVADLEALLAQATELQRLRQRLERFEGLYEAARSEVVGAEALLAEAARVLAWMHSRGGLGLDVHDQIRGLLAKLPKSQSIQSPTLSQET